MAISIVSTAVTGTYLGVGEGLVHTINLPASLSSGNLLLIIMRVAGSSSRTATTPSGWTLVNEYNGLTDGSTGKSFIFGKISNGAEGASVTTTLDTEQIGIAAVAYQLSGASGVADVEASYLAPTDNPPSVTASWGSDNNLFIAVLSSRRSDNGVSALPTNYTNQLTGQPASNTATTRASIFTGTRALAAASDDPGVFTTTGTTDTLHAATIVVKPSAAASTFSVTTEPLYYGATLLANKTGLMWRVSAGQTDLQGTATLGFGTTGTTNGSGVFTTPTNLSDEGTPPTDNDPVFLHLYWEEGSSPVVDRSLIVKANVVESV